MLIVFGPAAVALGTMLGTLIKTVGQQPEHYTGDGPGPSRRLLDLIVHGGGLGRCCRRWACCWALPGPFLQWARTGSGTNRGFPPYLPCYPARTRIPVWIKGATAFLR